MMRTLIEKELRENLRWLWVGLALIGSLLWYATPTSLDDRLGYTENEIAGKMFFGATMFALGLGVMQSFLDLRVSSRSFLFHRSVSISSIFYSKLISGAILYSVATGIPLCLVAIWFAWQGLDYLPVRPIQVCPAAVVALACFGFHPAAMLMLARSGKWFGTKLLPLLFVAPLFGLGLASIGTIVFGPFVNALILLLILFGITIVIAAARHVWEHSVADEGNFPRHSESLALKMTLSFAAVVFVSFFLAMFFSLNESRYYPSANSTEDYAIDTDGNLWWAKSKRIRNGLPVFVSGDQLRKDELPDVRRTLPENLKLFNLSELRALRRNSNCIQEEQINSSDDQRSFFDCRGSVLLYDETLNPPLQETISRDGKPFAGDPRTLFSRYEFGLENDGEPSFWADRNGLYCVAEPLYKVEVLVERHVKALAAETTYKSNAETTRQLTILSDGKLYVYRVTDQDGNDFGNRLAKRDDGKLGVAIKEIAVSPPLPPANGNDIRFCFTKDSRFVVVLNGRRPSFLTYDSKLDDAWKATPFRNPKDVALQKHGNFAFSVFPALFSVVFACSFVIDNLSNSDSPISIESITYFLQDEYGFFILAIVVVLLSMVVTCYACHRRMLSRSETIRWCCWAVLLGVATPIAVLAIYTRHACVRCTGCEKKRRIDLRKCEHCGCEWERPAPMGIEIFDDGLGCEAAREVVSHGI